MERDYGFNTDESIDGIHFDDLKYDDMESSMIRNDSTKSIVLAPFNSTIGQDSFLDDVEILEKKAIKFMPSVIDYDMQYEKNNNCEVDNGVYNKLVCEYLSQQSSMSVCETNAYTNPSTSSIRYDPQLPIHTIKEDIVKKVEAYGFKRDFILQSLKNNVKNHATASYYVLLLS